MFCNHSDINNKTIFSFEVFPPKKNMPIDTIFKTLDELRDLRPDFISVTFGAGGSENCDN
ncbi:MAG: methylenetetrahydrofolate reductase, partial [Treponema sp.]|nr:methylenetetrahydrofolate reductase [Treponema sp.]